VEDDHVLYRTVVDLAGHTDAANDLLNEAAYFLMREGEVLFTDFRRVYQDAQAIYGLTLWSIARTEGTFNFFLAGRDPSAR
jgi:hypothetical protein